MRKLLYVLTIATFSFAIMSCRQITLVVNGAKKPKIETPDHMETFLHSTGCTEAKTAILKFDALPSAIANGMIPTQVYVFDKAGNGLKLPGATNKCAPDPSIFIQNLDPFKQYKMDTSLDLRSMIDFLNTTHNEPFHADSDGSDFYVFVTWAVWPGKKVFKRDIMSCISAVRKNKNSRICLLLVNVDMQSAWGEDNLKRVEFTTTSMRVNLKGYTPSSQ